MSRRPTGRETGSPHKLPEATRRSKASVPRETQASESTSPVRLPRDTGMESRSEVPPEIFLHKNTQGGIFVHEQDIEALFKFIDKGNFGRISHTDLKKRLSIFARELSSKDYKFMMAGKTDISLQELFDILRYNELDDFDPIAEAFKYFDPEGTGFIDLNRLREIFHGLGYGELSYGDMQILVECADADLDGKISLEDFRRLIPTYHGDTQGKSIKIETDPQVHAEFMQSLKEYGDTRR